MAFPTAVNSQITDSVQMGADNAQSSLPGKIVQMSRAFTQTLEMENTVFQNQLNGIVNMVLNAMQRVAELNGDSPAAEATKTELNNLVENLKNQVTDGIAMNGNGKAAAPALPTTNPNEQTLESVVVMGVGESYKNAIAAQQQMYVTMQAAVSMTITTILSIDTADAKVLNS